ncbi:MAG: methylmalonyl Co-A mutase-associated GTPase MeaB [Pseudomonadota bacterium]
MSVAERVIAKDMRVAARLMRDLDDGMPSAREVLKELYVHTGKARIVGITGPPGSGKSTLVDGLISRYRKKGCKVGVVAVDPSSPFSGGAILGDRIRMNRHAVDDGVFIRSMASRGTLGGLSKSTNDVVMVLDAMGFDPIFVETVGVGQAEVDIVEAAHLSVVVVVPGLGDEVQAIKAGILEIADVLCLNKADRQGADRAAHDLQTMLELRHSDLPKPPILHTVATSSQGLEELAQEIDKRTDSKDRETWEERLLRRARRQVEELVKEQATAVVLESVEDCLDEMIRQVAARKLDPYSMVEKMILDFRS